MMTMWICDICKRPNNLLEGAECATVKCEGDLQEMEDVDMSEVEESVFERKREEWDK